MNTHPLIDPRIAGSGSVLTVDETKALTEYSLISGDRAFTGTVGGILPIDSAHLTTKEYVDTLVAGLQFDMFLDDLDSTINDPDTTEDYYSLQITQTGAGTTTSDAYAALGQGDGQEVVSYISGANLPFAQLQAGVVDLHIHARKNSTGQKIATIFGRLYHRADDETEILIATTKESAELTNVVTDYNLHGNITSVVDFSATDRLLLKIRANVESAGGANAEIEITQEGAEDSFISALVTTDTLSEIFLRQDGTKPLTGAWSMGDQVLTNVNIDDGTIDGTIIGASTAATGKFTTLTVDTGVADNVTWETVIAGLTGTRNTDAATDGVGLLVKRRRQTGIYLNDGDLIFEIQAKAPRTSTSYRNSVVLEFRAGGEHHTGGDETDIPGEFAIKVTREGSSTPTERFLIEQDGATTINGTLDSGAITSTGTSSFDSPTLVVDSANRRVGIGTASPDQQVEVYGVSPIIRIRATGTIDNAAAYVEFGRTTDGWVRTGYVGDGISSNEDIYLVAEENDLKLGDSSSNAVLTLSGGDATFSGAITAQGQIIIDVDSTEALLVRQNGDGGDVLIVDTTNERLGVNIVPTAEFGVYFQSVAGEGQCFKSADGGANQSTGKLDFSTGDGGGSTTTGLAGGVSGNINVTVGAGGTATSAGVNLGGTGGSFIMKAGSGGVASGGATNVGGGGGSLSINAGSGGAGSTVGGAGGSVTITSGIGGGSAADGKVTLKVGLTDMLICLGDGSGVQIGSAVNHTKISDIGDVTFAGTAGFYPRLVRQDGEPANGTGSTQIDDEEMIFWIDTNDGNRVYFMYNDNTNTNIVKVELN